MATRQLKVKERLVTIPVNFTDSTGKLHESVKTSCKAFGACFIDGEGKLTGECLKCKQSAELKEICYGVSPSVLAFNKPKKTARVKKEKVEKTPREETKTDKWKSEIIALIISGLYSGKEIRAKMSTDYAEYDKRSMNIISFFKKNENGKVFVG
jgi:hypothetical protein